MIECICQISVYERNVKVNFIEKNKSALRLVLNVLTSVMLFVSGILLIISCYSIYKSGSFAFTRESIATAFSKIAVIVYLTLGIVTVGVVFNIAFPADEHKLVGKRTDKLILSKLTAKVSLDNLDGEIKESVERERRLRFSLFIANIVLIALSVALPLIYLLNPANFPAEHGKYNAEIMRGMIVYTACLLPLFIYEIVYVIIVDKSIKREIEILSSITKTLPAQNVAKTDTVGGVYGKIRQFFSENQKPITLGMRISLIGAAVVFIVVGVVNGGMNDVLQKAIKICTECIGLG